MKKLSIATLTLILILGFYSVSTAATEQEMPFPVYSDNMARGNHFIPSGWMGDFHAIKFSPTAKDNPQSGQHCIKISYNPGEDVKAGWAGIYWQNPANNWGKVKGGFNLVKAKKVIFWARGENGGEIAEFKVGGITGEYSDSDSASTGPVELTKEWKKYEIDLAELDLSYISGGFCWVSSYMDNPEGITLYIDDVKYE
ncbi:MAG: hypothetical protein JW728_05735 [Candidatus Aureabacteria bacterium]|nr:hypothetical protein [Candidatus Auribacterota bacterium]